MPATILTMPLTNTTAYTTGANHIYSGTLTTNVTPLQSNASRDRVLLLTRFNSVSTVPFTNTFSGAATTYLSTEE
jgi:hypothetical protein